MSIRHMLPQDVLRIHAANEYGELAEVALGVIKRMESDQIGMVCGPITTGGLGDHRVNLWNFNAAIETLLVNGYPIFNQTPFEVTLARLERASGNGYDDRILTEFYAPIFESGHITHQYFMHNWRSSRGALWEHESAQKRGTAIVYLDENHLPVL